jgi:hypothetical protein
MSERFRSISPPPRALIAMAHVPSLPGSSLHHAEAGISGAIDAAHGA